MKIKLASSQKSVASDATPHPVPLPFEGRGKLALRVTLRES